MADNNEPFVSPATFNMTHTRTGDTDSFDFGDGDTPTPTGDLSNGTVTFTEAATRENITSGSTLSILMSKIRKFFSDLKAVAFSGSYSDLDNKPQVNGETLTGNKSLADLGITPSVTNETLTFH